MARWIVPGLAASAVAALFAVASVAQGPAGEIYSTRLLTAAFQPPARAYSGDGRLTAALSGSRLTISGRFEGLDAKVTKVRLLTGSAVGVPTGEFVADLAIEGGPASGTISGTVDLGERAALLSHGRLYVQVETDAAPEGALWGWLLPDHPFPGENVPEKRNWYAR